MSIIFFACIIVVAFCVGAFWEHTTCRRPRVELHRLTLIAANRILRAGFNGPPDLMALAVEELLDPRSIHQEDIGSIAAHFGLWD